jgi:hypothetical protein
VCTVQFDKHYERVKRESEDGKKITGKRIFLYRLSISRFVKSLRVHEIRSCGVTGMKLLSTQINFCPFKKAFFIKINLAGFKFSQR